MSNKQVVFDYGHLWKAEFYSDDGLGRFVLKLLDQLAAIHKYGIEEVTKTRLSRQLTASGKKERLQALPGEIKQQLSEVRTIAGRYGDRIAELESQMAPKRHDRNDVAWAIEVREIRDYIRSLDVTERERFVLDAVERGDQRTMEAVQFSPIPLAFATEDVIAKIVAARAAAQFPEEAAKLNDFRRARSEILSALGSVEADLARKGVERGTDAVSEADAA